MVQALHLFALMTDSLFMLGCLTLQTAYLLLLTLQLCQRYLPGRLAARQRQHLLLTLLHVAVAENSGDDADSHPNPEIAS